MGVPLEHLPSRMSEEFGMPRSEARRLIAQGAVSINGFPLMLHEMDWPADSPAVLNIGTRREMRIGSSPTSIKGAP
jgi:16S rRNA U516 pseudouridylate synthase RsuA-like enzyme